jgi:hypothetical protein
VTQLELSYLVGSREEMVKYLLTNGGFFFPDENNMEARKPIGATSSSNDFVEIPPQYKQYYKELRDGNQFLSAGPSLKKTVPLRNMEFRWNNRNKRIAGSLAHASQSNERLAIAVVGRDKYIFAYTAANRFKAGVDVNDLRDLIDTFLKAFTTSSVAAATTVLNLDGGGSIFVAWRKRGKETVIARGSVNDDGPPFENDGFNKKPREVANFLKLSVA